MFTMMNEARLFVGVQGVAIGERAYQGALKYAQDRVQGKVAGETDNSAIVHHPDVRRMLMDMKTSIMGARAINLATASAGDLAKCAIDDDTRKAAHKREALLTPIAKSYGSDVGVKATSLGVQIHGGMGFIEETGAAQHYRDARIAPIYEGTNGIQAIDLVGRKVRRDGGEAMRNLIAELEMIAEHSQAVNVELVKAIKNGVSTLRQATDVILGADDTDALAVASAYLDLCGDVISAGLLLKGVHNGIKANDPHAQTVIELLAYHVQTILPRAASRITNIKSGARAVFAIPADHLADL